MHCGLLAQMTLRVKPLRKLCESRPAVAASLHPLPLHHPARSPPARPPAPSFPEGQLVDFH